MEVSAPQNDDAEHTKLNVLDHNDIKNYKVKADYDTKRFNARIMYKQKDKTPNKFKISRFK